LPQVDRTVRLAAITCELNWAYRQTCSNEKFDLGVAEGYIRDHIRRGLHLMATAADLGAEQVLGAEYFRGSELFTTTRENQLRLTERPDGETFRLLSDVARERNVYLAAAYNAIHDDDLIAQTGVIVGRRGELVGTHVKHNSIPDGSSLERRLDLFDLDIAKTGMLICADVTDDPENPLRLARQGMELLLVPGVGFCGENWRHVIISRAIDLKCPVVYSDTSRAMIVSNRGAVLAEAKAPELVIVADVEIGRP